MLLAAALLSGLLVVWGVVTLAFFAVWCYQMTISLHEEETLLIDEGEAHLVREQTETFAKLDKVRPYVVGSLSASVALGILAAGVWVFEQLTLVP